MWGSRGSAIVTALFLCSRWCLLVADVAGSETAHSRACWGELSGWGNDWGCSKGSGMVFRRFRAVVHGPEWGKAGGYVNDDVAGLVDA